MQQAKGEPKNVGLGAYFQRLRENGRKISQGRLATELSDYLSRNVDSTTVWRIESGDNIPGGDLLAALMDLLGGRVEDVGWLIRNQKTVVEADGLTRADACIAGNPPPDPVGDIIATMPATASPDEVADHVKDVMNAMNREQQQHLVRGLLDWLSGWSARQHNVRVSR